MKERIDGEWIPVLHGEIVGIVERQIAENNPKEALERFIKLGYDRDEAIEKIGSVVIGEIYIILALSKNLVIVKLSILSSNVFGSVASNQKP